MSKRTVCILLAVWVLALLYGVLFVGSARASTAPRCRGLKPYCSLTAEPVCLCQSKLCLDSLCRWQCGVLGRASR